MSANLYCSCYFGGKTHCDWCFMCY